MSDIQIFDSFVSPTDFRQICDMWLELLLPKLSESTVVRCRDITEYQPRGEHDVVLLQEVWVEEDYETIRALVSDTFPHSHFFENGIIGSGTCVFSRVQGGDSADKKWF